ncbi:MAG TPA: urea ABC transporter ATP-binding subunit UrtE [Abditibacteriaceae bacterium]|jgi:urea transport system ATP-binding protein
MLHLEDIESGYGGSTVLRRVNLRVEPGQVVCLMGLNGVGKTTLLKTIMGLLRAHGGKVRFEGHDLTAQSPDRRARAGIGYVPQGREIFPQLTVQENLILGLEARRGRPGEKQLLKSDRDKVPDIVFDMFPILGKMLTRKGGALSGGQQQQLAIGRALASQPKLLLLDEPMEGIQPSVVQQIEEVIETLKKQKETAVLLVEQSLGFATTIADYSYILNHGKVVAEGDASQLSAETVRGHLTV